MQKLKSLKWSNILTIIKCCLVGLLVTLVGIVAFAVVLKFANLNSKVISYVNDAIKAISLFMAVLCLKKFGADKLLIKSIILGALYAVLSFIVFSILNGGFSLTMAFVYDLIFAIIVSVIATVILNIFRKN